MGGVVIQYGKCSRSVEGHRCHPRSNGLSVLYGLEPWWVDSFSDANFFEGQFKVIRGRPRSNGFIIVVDMNLGGSSHLSMLKLWGSVPGQQGSSNSNKTFHAGILVL